MVEEGKYVQIDYTGKLDSGEVFDTSEGRMPLEFKVGAGSMIPGLEKAVVGMKIDEEKDISLKPEEAYGEYNDSLKESIPKKNFPEDMKPEIGMTIAVQTPHGQRIPAQITDIGDDDVTLDLNHPLAGKNLNFYFKVLAVNDEPQLQGGCDCSSGGCAPSTDCSSDGCGC